LRSTSFIVFLFLIGACATEPNPGSTFIQFRTDGSSYMQSDPLIITVSNLGTHRLRLQPGSFVFQQLTSNGWRAAGGTFESSWVILSPGQQIFQHWSLNGSTPLGKARLEFLQVQILDSTGAGGTIPELPLGELRSNEFIVTAGNPL
jgi:hypothetical protein